MLAELSLVFRVGLITILHLHLSRKRFIDMLVYKLSFKLLSILALSLDFIGYFSVFKSVKLRFLRFVIFKITKIQN